MKSLAFVIPIYNEAENIASLLDRLLSVADRLERQFALQVRLVFIDDGSADDSYDILKAQDFGGRPAQIVQFSRNFGKEAALSAGLEAAADADAVILMDADLQHPPEAALDFVKGWLEEGYDSVYSYKDQRRKSEGALRALMSWLFYRTINHGARFVIPRDAGDFRLLTQPVCHALLAMPENQRFMKGLYGWVGFRQKAIPFTPEPRVAGTSSFRPAQLFAMTLDALTSFTIAPLRFMALFGLIIACLSTLYGIFIVVERLLVGGNPAGIASVLTLISFFGGMQMLALGLLGEYVGKGVLEAKNRPSFIIRDRVTINANGPAAGAETQVAQVPMAGGGR
ncbi:glycosyltransferase family 2 protein [Paracoccus jeotgali]|uniref:glycosyltransferase family 2 protein n=1 Tax=Paracoccus jeotgali TaxID=2065379 RepID=UPI0028B189FC|nr:glycosyltransferase family 2 protein [Paracoccus jeotgali]